MKFLAFLFVEMLRLAVALAAWLALVALALLVVPSAPAAPISLTTRVHGPWSRTAPVQPSHHPLLARSVPAAPSVPSRGRGRERRETAVARITVYAPDEPRSDRWTRRRKSATGARLDAGHCAVDPRRIPYGSTIIVAGRRLLAVDCGGGVRGWHVDVFFPRWRDARAYDRATPDRLPITVIRPRS